MAEPPAETIDLAVPPAADTAISVPATAPFAFLPDRTVTVPLGKTLRLSFSKAGLKGAAATLPQGRAGADPFSSPLPVASRSAASLDWNFSSYGGLGFAASNSVGATGLEGDFGRGAFSFGGFGKRSAAGLSARGKLGDGWVTSINYSVDTTQLDLKTGAAPDLPIGSAQGQSYGVSIAKHGLFGSADTLGLSLSRPSQDYFGKIELADTGLSGRVARLNDYRGMALLDNANETDIALGYVTTFFGGVLALQANAGYRLNAYGQNGGNSVAVLSRAKINF